MNPNLSQMLDGQGNLISGDFPFVVSKSLTINGNNETKVSPIFTLTGAVLLGKIWGVVTTDLSSNITAAFLRLNDQAAQVNLTLNTGVALSALKAGSVILKKGLVGAALVKVDNAAGAISEPTTLETMLFSPIMLVKKTGALTQIEFDYATTNAPASGVIKFFAAFAPLSDDGSLVAA